MQETQVHVIPLYGAGEDLAVHTSEVDDPLWVGDAEEPSGRLLLYIGSHCLRMQFAFDSRKRWYTSFQIGNKRNSDLYLYQSWI